MKTIVLFLFSFISVISMAQNYDYCKLKQTGDDEIYISKNEGPFELLKNDKGKEIKDVLEALIFMESKKWEFVVSYAKCVKSPSNGEVIIIGDDTGCKKIENYLIFKSKKPDNKK